MSKVDALLILGCRGYKDEEDETFIYCHGSHNPILELGTLDEQTYYKVVDFLDKACGLFDGPVNDYNKCSNILNLLYRNYKVITPEMLKKIQYYFIIHKRCRPFLILKLKEDYYGK